MPKKNGTNVIMEPETVTLVEVPEIPKYPNPLRIQRKKEVSPQKPFEKPASTEFDSSVPKIGAKPKVVTHQTKQTGRILPAK